MHTPTHGEITLMLQLKSCSGGIAGEEMGCTVFLNPWISILLFKEGDQNPGRWVLGAEAAQVILGPTVLPTSTGVIPTLFSFLHACGVHLRAAGAAGSSGAPGLKPDVQGIQDLTPPGCGIWHRFRMTKSHPQLFTLFHLLSGVTLRFSEHYTFSGFRNR